MMKNVLTFLVVIAISMAACPASSNINNLLADSVSFTVNSASALATQSYNYQFQSVFSTTPTVAIALSGFGFNIVGPNNFAIRPLVLNTSGATFQFVYSSSVWASLKINFWVSSNPEIQVGFFEVANLTTGTGICEGCAYVNTSLKKAFGSADRPVIRVFLNGFNLNSKSSALQLSVSPTDLQQTNLTIKVTMGTLTIIDYVALSWVAFSPSTSSFVSYGGQVSQSSYSGSKSQDISSTIYKGDYTLYGLNLISIISGKPITFTSSISQDFVLTIASSIIIDSFSLIYLAVAPSPYSLCAKCGPLTIANGNLCVSACPSGTYTYTYKDGGVTCRTCSSALGLILSNGQCVTGTTTTTTSTTTTVVTTPVVTTTNATNSNSGSSTGTSTISTSSATGTTNGTKTNSTTTTGTTTTGTTSTSTSTSTSSITRECQKNAYWNGNDCVCQVGYVNIDGVCQTPTIHVSIPVIISYPGTKTPCKGSSTGTTETSTGTTNTSTSTNTTSSANTSTSTGSTSTNSTSNTSTSTGSTSTSTLSCGANSYDNGLGVCVCSEGYYKSGDSCVIGTPCGINSQKTSTGTCQCLNGYTNYNGVCSQCAPGAFWSSASKKCIFVCGQNSEYSSTAGACVCLQGYGNMNGLCQTCPTSYFVSNGYCVTCPVNSQYNSKTRTCDCKTGYYTNQYGICSKKCGTNEVYNVNTQSCSCLSGLGRINGVCTICLSGTQATSDGVCSNCGLNQQLQNGKCICKAGYAFNSAKVCTLCSQLPNGFLINGYCSVCPKSMIIINGNSCGCSQGKILSGLSCISQCKNDQLLDRQGNCYTCAANQIITHGQCTCKNGYEKNSCGVCTLTCSHGQFAFQGGCAVCPLNTVYNTQINGCSCPNGYYKDLYGVCQQLVLKAIDCASGQYFDTTNGCVACPGSCKTCSSATKCTSCVTTGYTPNSAGTCVPQCGDGLIIGSETCDTGNTYSSGCINCQIQTGYTCSGQPSVCKAPTPTSTGSSSSGSSTSGSSSSGSSSGSGSTSTSTSTTVTTKTPLYQSGSATVNSNNVFVTLKTNPTFTFDNPTDMQSFIKSSFPSGTKPTVYCSQRSSPELDTFDCLLIYPSGVPNSSFQVNFSYSYQGKAGSTSVTVDPFAVSNNRASSSSRVRN